MMTVRPMAALVLGLLIAGQPGTTSAQGTGSPAANWDQVVQCAKQSGSKARHSCLDQLLRDKGLIDTAHETAEAREAFGRSARVEAAAAPVAPPQAPAPLAETPATQSRAAPPVPRETKITAVQTTIASARLGADQKLLVTTTEGAVWKQTESFDIRTLPQKGDAFSIEDAALGGHRCKIGRSKIFRCQRLN